MRTEIKKTSKPTTKCYMASLTYYEINDYEEEWFALYRQLFCTAKSHDEAEEIAETWLEDLGFAYDEKFGWTDYRYEVIITVVSVDEDAFWDAPNFASDDQWKKYLLKWGDSHPELAARLLQIAEMGDQNGHRVVREFSEFRSIVDKHHLEAESKNEQLQREKTRAQSL